MHFLSSVVLIWITPADIGYKGLAKTMMGQVSFEQLKHYAETGKKERDAGKKKEATEK